MRITFEELHLRLKRDAFYGFPSLEKRKRKTQPRGHQHSRTADSNIVVSQTTGGPETVDDDTVENAPAEVASLKQTDYEAPITNAHRLVSKIYTDFHHIEQVQEARRTFRGKWFGDDIHRELIYLWCSFLGLPAYRDDRCLDWNWQDYIQHWDTGLGIKKGDFEFKNEELRDFLRNQHLPLPAYFFFGDSDYTHNSQVVEIALKQLAMDGTRPNPTAGRQTQRDRTEQMRTAWQKRINQLAKQPKHRGKPHKSLCKLVAAEPIGQGKDAETIRRRTKKP